MPRSASEHDRGLVQHRPNWTFGRPGSLPTKDHATPSRADLHRYRGPGPRARAPHPGDHPQGRQGRDHPAGAADRPGDRPGYRRTLPGTDLPDIWGAAAGPARRWADRPPPGPQSRNRQARRAAPSDTRSSPRRWMPASRYGTCRKPPRMPIRVQRCATIGPGPRWTGTPPILSPLTSPEPPGRRLGTRYLPGQKDGQADSTAANRSLILTR
jgi:hypothetical protein